jgi:hypothetical protein
MIGSAEGIEGLYYLKLQDTEVHVCSADGVNNIIIPTQAIWHFRLGHLSHNRLEFLHSVFPYITFDNKGVCDVCHLAKHKRKPYKISSTKAVKPFEIIHMDIWGPISTTSINGFSYFLTAVDDYSRFTCTIFMKHKSETRQNIMNFVHMVETQYNSKVKIIRSDNGVEFLIPNFYNSKGILHHTSCVETPEQNGRVERKHQHLLNVGRALLFQAKLPKTFWSFAISHSTYLINRIPTPLLNNKSPFELQNKALKNEELKEAFLATRQAKDPLAKFCQVCREVGYDIYVMELISAGEEFHAAMKRSTNGGGENSPMLACGDDFYELFLSALEEK